jgi:hypothetical protein
LLTAIVLRSRPLEGLSKLLGPSEAEDHAGEAEERLVDLGVAFVAGAQPAKVVQVREAALDDPALPAEIGAVLGSQPGDDGLDAARPEQPPVLVVIIAAVGEDEIGLLPGAAWLARRPGGRAARRAAAAAG